MAKPTLFFHFLWDGCVKNISKVKQVLGNFWFSEFRIIRDFRFYQDGSSSNIDVVVECEDRKPNYQLKISFEGVSGLKIKDFGGGETRIIGFDIEDVTQLGWEKIAWKVVDFENDAIQFFAMDISIVSINSV